MVETDRLFINVDGEPLQIRSIQNRIELYGKLSGITIIRLNVRTGSTLYVIIQETSRQAYAKGSVVGSQKKLSLRLLSISKISSS